MDILLVLENEFLDEMKRDGITNFMDFVMTQFCREKRREFGQIWIF